MTSLQSLIAGEVQMEADELDSREAVRELQNPTIVPDIGGAIALCAALLEDVAFANLLLFDAVTGSDWDRGLFALMLKHTEVFEALPGYAHRALVAAHMRNMTQLGFRPGLLDELLEPWVGSDGQAATSRPGLSSALNHLLRSTRTIVRPEASSGALLARNSASRSEGRAGRDHRPGRHRPVSAPQCQGGCRSPNATSP